MASVGKGKPKFQSLKVGQTLQDLEAAFADWEKLSDEPAQATKSEKQIDPDLRKKTKKLLEQLREQLSDLAD